LSGRRVSSQSRLEFSHALQASGAAFISISGLIYFSREAAPLLSRRFSFSICSSSVTPSFDFRAARLWFLSVFVSNRFSRSTPGGPITSPRFLGVDKLSSDISYRHHAVQVLSVFHAAAAPFLCAARLSGSPGEPCHRFDLPRFRFVVRFLGSIDCHRFFIGSFRFCSLLVLSPVFHWFVSVSSPSRAACRQTTSHRRCCVSAIVSSGLAKSAHAPPAAPVATLVLPQLGLGSRSTVPLSASSLLVRFLFGSENLAIARQV
jgi:hypothetical protein